MKRRCSGDVKNIQVGIVILNYITWADTECCIKSIRDTLRMITYKIYLVDNASPILPNSEIQSFIRNSIDIVFILSEKNCGYAAGNNIGIEKALGDGCGFILVTNNDIVFQKECIANMIKAFNIYDKVGIIGPLVINAGKEIQKSTNFHEGGLKQKYIAETLLRKLYPKYRMKCFGRDSDYHKTAFVYSVSGCCFMLSNICAGRITPLDENTFLYCEEAIIGKQMKKAGFKTLYYPEVSVIHKHGSSTSYVGAFSYVCRVSSELYYCKRYLGSNMLSILPLYVIRSLSYLMHSILKKDYRNNLGFYFKKTFHKLINGDKWQ